MSEISSYSFMISLYDPSAYSLLEESKSKATASIKNEKLPKGSLNKTDMEISLL